MHPTRACHVFSILVLKAAPRISACCAHTSPLRCTQDCPLKICHSIYSSKISQTDLTMNPAQVRFKSSHTLVFVLLIFVESTWLLIVQLLKTLVADVEPSLRSCERVHRLCRWGETLALSTKAGKVRWELQRDQSSFFAHPCYEEEKKWEL